ncbi:MAG: hypothetical protein NTW16_02410, partial [Bacteroidetes bacterium]|nr:hypothetical protein [Bacteroidota bacterium]
MKRIIFLTLALALFLEDTIAQNTLDYLGLSSSSPAQVAYSLRKLSSSYSGPAIKVRRSTDNAEGEVAFDGAYAPPAYPTVSSNSVVTLTPGFAMSGGTTGSGLITAGVAGKTGTIAMQIQKSGSISASIGFTTVT